MTIAPSKNSPRTKRTVPTTPQKTASQAKELGAAQTKLKAQVEQHPTERGQLSECVNLLQELRIELKEEICRLTDRVDQAAAEPKERTDTLFKLQQTEAERDKLKAEAAEARSKLIATQSELEAERQALFSAHAEVEAEKAARAAAEKTLGESQASAAKAAEKLRQALEQQTAKLRATEAERDSLQKENAARSAKLKARFDELAKLTKLFDETEKAAGTARKDAEAQKTARAAAEKTLDEAKASAAKAAEELRQALEQQTAKLRDVEVERDKLKDEVDTLGSKLRASDAASVEMHRKLGLAMEQHKKLEKQQAAKLREYEQEASNLKAKYEELFKKSKERIQEISKLTGIIQERDAEIDAFEARIDASEEIKMSFTMKIGSIVTFLFGHLSDTDGASFEIERAAAFLKLTGIVDDAWYLETYKDVAAANMDPAEHYLLYGAREGREPFNALNVLAKATVEGAS